jgi:LysR family transcriptional regulator, regulator for genes of the gallate degradation pathway
MKIDPRHLTNLMSIAEHGSFNRAAAARGISQPALSNSIAQLERRLGVEVLTRTRRGSELTAMGKILLRGAETIDAVLTQAEEEVRLKRLGVEGPLRIGVVPSVTLKLMPDVLSLLLRRHPSIELTFIEGLDDQLLPSLQAGQLDLVVGPLAGVFPAPADIVEDPLFDDPFSIGVGPRHPLRNRGSLTLAELRDAPWILPLPGNSYRRHIEALFMTAGVPWPRNCVITSSLNLVESIVAQTERVTIITELQSIMQNTWRLKSIPLKGAGKRTLGLKWRKAAKPSALAANFVHIAHEVADSLVDRKKRAVARSHPARRALRQTGS